MNQKFDIEIFSSIQISFLKRSILQKFNQRIRFIRYRLYSIVKIPINYLYGLNEILIFEILNEMYTEI